VFRGTARRAEPPDARNRPTLRDGPTLVDTVRRLLDAGAKAGQPVSDVGGGKLTATVLDPDGSVIGLIQEP
jgi:hypothetical protein